VLAVCTARHAFSRESKLGPILEVLEHLGLPLGLMLLNFLLANSGLVVEKVACMLLLGVQSALVVLKIIYFGSLTEELAQYIRFYSECL
jgi:hypothetical protein